MQGLIGKSFNKLDSDEINTLFKSHDIILFCVTWGNNLFNYSKPGFKHILLNRTEKHKRARRDSGGLIVYIADRFYHEDMLIKTIDDCMLWFKLRNVQVGQQDDVCLFIL